MVKHWDCSYHNLVRCKLMESRSRDHRCWVSLGEAEGEICLSSGVGGGGFPGERVGPGSWAPSLHMVKGLFYGKYPKGLF